MPSEDSFKAQIQAALAKKKQQQAAVKPEPEKTPPPEPKVEVQPVAPPPAIELVNAPPQASASEPTPVATPTTLVFAGQSIRFTTHQQQVYFAVTDVLPLARTAEWNNKFVEFTNNPDSKKDAEDLTKILTFKDEDGSDKTHGATGENIIKIFHTLKLRAPGPLGRWLNEVSALHKPKD
jgi:hypothetical protein